MNVHLACYAFIILLLRVNILNIVSQNQRLYIFAMINFKFSFIAHETAI